MKKEITLIYLRYAMKNNKPVEIQTKNNKFMKVNIFYVTDITVNYSFINNKSSSSVINLENIVDVAFINKKDDRDFRYYLLEIKYKTNNLKSKIENLEKYYIELIDILLSKEKINSIGYKNLSLKKNVYPKMFKNLVNEHENLLFYYFTKKSAKEAKEFDEINRERLLIVQANLSQKIALENALNERVSIIEGPPGTGKTTTILNILANSRRICFR